MDLVKKAEKFATERHKGQKYGREDYVYHLKQVADTAWMFTRDPICVAVAWLHDILEDTETNPYELQQEFGSVIANAVFALTDKDGKDREERHLNTYYSLRDNDIALKVKLCDRLCNMRESVTSIKLSIMYSQEYKSFKFCLYTPNTNLDFWDALDEAYNDLID